MKIISHRSNVEGFVFAENSIEAIDNAIDQGFDVEIDLWLIDGAYYVGHDLPVQKVCIQNILSFGERAWVHCKNIEALSSLSSNKDVNVFWHEKDKYTITSTGFVWCFPGQPVPLNGIAVLPQNGFTQQCFAVCVDNPLFWKWKP